MHLFKWPKVLTGKPKRGSIAIVQAKDGLWVGLNDSNRDEEMTRCGKTQNIH